VKPTGRGKGTLEEIKALLNNLRDDDWWVRKETVRKLLAYPEDLYLSDLEKWLRNGEDAILRNASMETYKELGERALLSLVFFLRDEDSDVRIFAANVLGDIKSPIALQALVKAVQDRDDNVRIAVVEALGKIGDTRAVDLLTALLGDMPWTAMAAIEALGKIGGEKALPALYKCLENQEYRGMACSALEKAGDRSSIEHLVPLIDRDDTKEMVLQAIVGIADREKLELSPSQFACNIDQLTDWLNSPQDGVRRAAFIALSWSEDPRGLPYFLKALQDDLLLEYALKGLLSLGDQAVPEIIKAMQQPWRNKGMLAKVLSMTGEKEALILFANDEDDEVRAEVALALGQLRTSEAAEALQALSRDPVEEVQAAALLSLINSERDADYP
jgi:HEAT repeat protein